MILESTIPTFVNVKMEIIARWLVICGRDLLAERAGKQKPNSSQFDSMNIWQGTNEG